MREGVKVADKYFDTWKQTDTASVDNGMRYLLTDHANKLPPLSEMFDSYGAEVEIGPNNLLTLMHCPSVPSEKKDTTFFGTFRCSINDPWLTSISCSYELGEKQH
eukprot:15338577-Ditylum_brightwellii.AAC.2